MKTIIGKSIKSLMVLAVSFIGISTAANADILKRDTVYVIEDMYNNYAPGTSFPLSAYKVEDNDTLTKVETGFVDTNYGSAVGLAVCTKNKRIFVSHEFEDTVDVIDAETFEVLSELNVPTTNNNIAGMVFSENRGRLYVVDRSQPKIFVYTVNASGNVVRVQSEEFNATSGVWGVDVWENKLYCTHGYSTAVTVYDLDSKTEITADSYNTTSPRNMAIAVDGSDNNHTLAYTTWSNRSSSPSVVTQFDTTHDIEKRLNLGRDGRGLSVNPAKGLVYAVAGDGSDADAPVLRTYKEDQFTTDATPPTPTPWDEKSLIDNNGEATDVFAAGVTFDPNVYIEIIDPADKNVSVGMEVTFEITIKNPSAENNMTLHDMEDLYNTNDISFISTSLQTGLDNTTDDGNISWSDMGIVIPPEGNITFTKTFNALREVNCSTETITVTNATYDTPEVPTPVEPFGNTLYFDIGPACGCDPELKEIGGGCTYNPNSKSFDMMYIFMMLTILFGGLAMRRKKTL